MARFGAGGPSPEKGCSCLTIPRDGQWVSVDSRGPGSPTDTGPHRLCFLLSFAIGCGDPQHGNPPNTANGRQETPTFVGSVLDGGAPREVRAELGAQRHSWL